MTRSDRYRESARRLDVALWAVVEDAATASSTEHMRALVRLVHRIEVAGTRARSLAAIFSLVETIEAPA